MKKSWFRKGEAGDTFFFVCAVFIFTAFLFYNVGFDSGVKASAQGRWTAVKTDLPNGDTIWTVSEIPKDKK